MAPMSFSRLRLHSSKAGLSDPGRSGRRKDDTKIQLSQSSHGEISKMHRKHGPTVYASQQARKARALRPSFLTLRVEQTCLAFSFSDCLSARSTP